jgi:hypothetical protein
MSSGEEELREVKCIVVNVICSAAPRRVMVVVLLMVAFGILRSRGPLQGICEGKIARHKRDKENRVQTQSAQASSLK